MTTSLSCSCSGPFWGGVDRSRQSGFGTSSPLQGKQGGLGPRESRGFPAVDVKAGAIREVLEKKRGSESRPAAQPRPLSILIHKMVSNWECWGLRRRQLPIVEDVGVSKGEKDGGRQVSTRDPSRWVREWLEAAAPRGGGGQTWTRILPGTAFPPLSRPAVCAVCTFPHC